jgi:ubiquinone/menaquinone biosynthesis C-methylase UbiE
MSMFSIRRSPESMKRLYNWFCRFYPRFEKPIGAILDEVVEKKIAVIENIKDMTAVDYACGTGTLTLKLAPLFASVCGIDQSQGMLSRARMRADQAGLNVTFREGNILDIEGAGDSVDFAFISFALHLFPIHQEIEILAKLLHMSRRGVMIIDHSRSWDPVTGALEWLEGGWYDQFIRTDFSSIAKKVGAASFDETAFAECMVLTFMKH